MRRLTCIVLGLFMVGATAVETSAPLRVAVYDVPPYGYAAANGEIDGVSVDLWRRVAGAMDRRYTLTPVADIEAVLGGLEQGRFDAAIGAITITPEREARVDFSYPAHRSGVAIAVRKETGPFSALQAYGAAAFELGGLIAVILLGLALTGLAMWAIERHSRAAERGESHVSSLRDGLYWAVVTMTTVGYGDKTPKTTGGRVIATLWMFGSLVLISLLSTSLVSRLTADRVERSDAAADIDLAGKRLAAVTASSGAEYLEGLHRSYEPAKDLAAALDALAAGKVDAVVNSVGALRYLVARRHATGLEVAGGLLAPAYMAFALPKGSQLKRPLDTALIRTTSGPEWVALEDRFFGR